MSARLQSFAWRVAGYCARLRIIPSAARRAVMRVSKPVKSSGKSRFQASGLFVRFDASYDSFLVEVDQSFPRQNFRQKYLKLAKFLQTSFVCEALSVIGQLAQLTDNLGEGVGGENFEGDAVPA